MSKNTFKEKIKNKKSTIGIIGLGYVGLPLAIRFLEEEFNVIGFDIDKKKVDLINAGKSYIKHINLDGIIEAAKDRFFVTTNFNRVSDLDIIIICVPTPLGVHNDPDLSFIDLTLKNIRSYVTENQLLILESTTYPGTTEDILIPFVKSIKHKELSLGVNYFLGYSPEREDPGNKDFTTKTIPKVVSGVTKNCLALTKMLYDKIVDQTIPVSSPRVAEMTKIMENIHRAINIGLVNELKILTDKMNINIHEVINAAASKPFGFTPYYPGPGLGGHCIPIDPFYLTWKAKEYGMNTRFIELAGEINTAMPKYVIGKVNKALNDNRKPIKGSKILVLGLSYKKNIDDLRESPSLELIRDLLQLGALVEYSDPYHKSIPNTRKYQFNLKSKEISANSLSKFDLVLLATDHDVFDYDLIEKNSKILVDTRGRYGVSNNRVIKA